MGGEAPGLSAGRGPAAEERRAGALRSAFGERRPTACAERASGCMGTARTREVRGEANHCTRIMEGGLSRRILLCEAPASQNASSKALTNLLQPVATEALGKVRRVAWSHVRRRRSRPAFEHAHGRKRSVDVEPQGRPRRPCKTRFQASGSRSLGKTHADSSFHTVWGERISMRMQAFPLNGESTLETTTGVGAQKIH